MFKNHLDRQVSDTLMIKLVSIIAVLFFFLFTDLYLMDLANAALIRVIALAVTVFMLFYHVFNPKPSRQKTKLYHITLSGYLLMMYALLLVYRASDVYSAIVVGLILVIFLVSLDLRANFISTFIIYFVPAALFVLVLVFFFPPSVYHIMNLINVLPMLALGLVLNRIQHRFRYRIFATNQELVLANKDLERSGQQLKQMVVTRDKFFSVLAHDLRSPFTALLGLSEIAANRNPREEPDAIKEDVVVLHNASKTLYNLTSNLLQWARSQTGNIVLQPDRYDLKLLLDGIASVVRVNASAKNIEVVNNVEPGLYVYVDKETIEVVFRNLLANAIKYSYPGGKVQIEAQSGNQTILVSIADEGVGMTKEKTRDLFNLNKAHSTKGTEKEQGTGLGLIICKEFLDLNNGKINVQSECGKGSTFTVELKAAGSNKGV